MSIHALQKPYFHVVLKGVSIYVIPGDANEVRSYGLKMPIEPSVPPIVAPGSSVGPVTWDEIVQAIAKLQPRSWA